MTNMVWSSSPSFPLQRTNNDDDDVVPSITSHNTQNELAQGAPSWSTQERKSKAFTFIQYVYKNKSATVSDSDDSIHDQIQIHVVESARITKV